MVKYAEVLQPVTPPGGPWRDKQSCYCVSDEALNLGHLSGRANTT